MIKNNFKLPIGLAASLIGLSMILVPVTVLAVASSGSGSPTTSTTNTDQQKLSNLINTGNQEINRRLTTLATLTAVINGSTKLTTTNKNSLTTQLTNAISGLTQLKSTLDNDTTLTTAKNDAQSIITSYRVYYLLVPQTYLLRVADTEQVTDTNLSALAAKLQSRITQAQTGGDNVTALNTQLIDVNNQIATAQLIETNVITAVAPLQPTDYNNDHSILSGYREQLITAHKDNVTAYNDAKSIIAALKSL